MVSLNRRNLNVSFEKHKDIDGKLFNESFVRSIENHNQRPLLSEYGIKIPKKWESIHTGLETISLRSEM